MAPHAARRPAGKLGGRDERRDTLIKYNTWHTAEYATPFKASDWLYSSMNWIKYSTVPYFDTLRPVTGNGDLYTKQPNGKYCCDLYIDR